MGIDAKGFHLETVFGNGAGDLLRSLGSDFLCHGGRAGEGSPCMVGHDVVGSAAPELLDLQVTGLGVLGAVGFVDQTLFAVNDGILSIGGEAHGGGFTPVGGIILHIGAAGFLVETEENTDAALQGQTAFFQGLQGVQSCHGGTLIVHGAAAIDAAVHDAAFIRRHSPAFAFGNHVQMAQNGNHLVAFAVFSPAHLIIHVIGAETQRLRQLQHVFQALLDGFAIGVAAVIIQIDTGDLDTFLQAFQQSILLVFDQSLKTHIVFSFRLTTPPPHIGSAPPLAQGRLRGSCFSEIYGKSPARRDPVGGAACVISN